MTDSQPENLTFKNRLRVTKWLKDEGWKVSKSTVYNRIGKAKLLPREDGLFHLKDVKKYASTFLKRQDTGMRVQTEQDELQRKRTALEIEKLEISNARDRHKQEVEEGLYIPRDQLYLELAARAGILDAGLNHWIRTNTAGWISLAAGDLKKVGELIAAMILGKDGLMNQYASVRNFTVIFEGEEEEEEQF